MSDEAYERGLAVRREVLGEEYVARALADVDDFNRDFQRHVTEHCWGAVWDRPGLSRAQRSLLTVALLAALNRPRELELHLRGALTNGCSVAEIRETLMQVVVYAGAPAGVEAFRVARQTLREAGVALEQTGEA